MKEMESPWTRLRRWAPWAALAVGAPLVVVSPMGGAMMDLAGRARFDGIDLGPLARADLAIQIHAGAAIAAFALGAAQLLGPKGKTWHRIAGWTWVGLMAVVAASALFIRELNAGQFSFIHGFVALTAVSLPLGVLAAKRGDIKAHRSHMTGLFIGGLIVAGAFTFLPGRIMWRVFFG